MQQQMKAANKILKVTAKKTYKVELKENRVKSTKTVNCENRICNQDTRRS